MIYTSYFANLRNITDDITPISIARFNPKWYTGLSYIDLAPTKSILSRYKETFDERTYVEAYRNIVLKRFDPDQLESDLYRLAQNSRIVLLCYEKPTDFCHRHIVSAWLNKHGIRCVEYYHR